MLPLWQRGMEGDFKDICLFIIHKISPYPSFPKRGIMGLDQKIIYKQTLKTALFGKGALERKNERKNISYIFNGSSNYPLRQCS